MRNTKAFSGGFFGAEENFKICFRYLLAFTSAKMGRKLMQLLTRIVKIMERLSYLLTSLQIMKKKVPFRVIFFIYFGYCCLAFRVFVREGHGRNQSLREEFMGHKSYRAATKQEWLLLSSQSYTSQVYTISTFGRKKWAVFW